ncbi:MAG: type III-A CRISPR-associated RAMP protein Csm5 [Tannerellaceae bacterium]|jgi:CRISPR-associated protein Csm5|nr:type III-A CRISPR-associated RAMP protein Csm5 [Tannerellaceae bacterium]
MINKKYNLEITVLSPLSIGAGAEKDWVKGIDFVVEGNKAYLLNLKKMIAQGINPEELTVLFAQKNEKALLQKIGGNLKKVSDKSIPLPNGAANNNDIKSFIKNDLSGKPIIPGSSLKGAVRSVIWAYLLDGLKTGILSEKKYFGDSNNGDELMRFIKFSDADFEETALVNTKIFNLRKVENNWIGGWKYSGDKTNNEFQSTGFNTVYECVMPWQKGVCSMMLSELNFDKLQHIKQIKKKELFADKKLFSLINQHTEDYIDKEIHFFEKYPTEKTDRIIESLEAVRNLIPVDDSYCILKMSAGSGFHSITGDWQYDDYSKTGVETTGRNAGKQKYKSRKVAVYDDVFSLMGFVKLRPMSDEEVKEFEQEREDKKRQEQQQLVAELNRKKAEKEAIRQREENKNEYERLVFQANNLFVEEKYEEAKEVVEKAVILLPEGTKHIGLLQNIDAEILRRKKAADRVKELEDIKQKEMADRLAANQVPLADKIKTLNKIPTLTGSIRTWMKQNNITSLSNEDLTVINNKVKEIYNLMKARDRKNFSLSSLSEIIGQDLVTQWSNEIKQ